MAEKKASLKKRTTASAQRKVKAAAPPPPPSAAKEPFPVVALGASAGGLEAFEQFFKNLPPTTRAGFVVLSHLDPKHSSIMSELIARFTPMTVHEAADGVEVKANHVYVIPPNKDLSIFHGKLQLTEQGKAAGTRMPIDFFLRSLAQDQGDRAVAVILSGTGSDGTLGLRDVQGAGGTVFVEDPASARYDGMPRSAVQTGLADHVLPVGEIARRLSSLLERYRTGKEPPDERMTDVMQKMLMVVRSKTGHDFSLYKKNTITRRIRRRMNVHNIENPAAYLRYLQEHSEEVQQLFKELLINVTSFFREPEAFEVLKKTVLPELLHDKPSDYTIRVWVPGCATGEEAYSIAMLIREYAEETHRDYRVQMFATDIDEESIAQARSGFFPSNIALDVPADRLAKFFIKDETGFRVRKDVREMIVFAVQNVAKDAPFTRLDLVSCRNVLIYMEADLQSKLMNLFHYSLKAGGVLFLGSSETIGHLSDLFSSIDRKWKFFRAKPGYGAHAHAAVPADFVTAERMAPPTPVGRINLEEMARSTLLSAFAPPAIIVNNKGDVLYVHGETGRFLTLAPGRPSLNIVNMARGGLVSHLRSALLAAVTHRQDAVYRGVRVKTDGGTETVDLAVKPLPRGEGEEPFFLFVFQEPPQAKAAGTKGTGKKEKADTGRVAELEKELAYTKESLQATVEEVQATNEELRSANEEMQSTNEEMQSTNEELETSKEELQSVNEELQTVNAELQSKIDQLSRSESDMKNLLDAADIATIFLGRDLHVKRFTASASRVINLIPSDVGRPIGDLTAKIEYAAIADKAHEVLERLRPFEAEVETRDHRSFLMRMLLYRTLDNVIDGVVMTFTDVTESKRAARERAEFAENIVQTVREPLLVLDEDLRVVMANRAFCTLFRVSGEATEGRPIKDLGGHEWAIPVLNDLLAKVAKADKVFEDFRVDADFPSIGPRTMLLNARKIKTTSAGSKPLILLAMEDVTSRKPAKGESKHEPKREA
ncbi:MAG TPA: chemotaxis protein CheB [Syntrophorhabdales bacterium]|nr:chemotaxis protein CheB [Syntrophorhabdales bacterium]